MSDIKIEKGVPVPIGYSSRSDSITGLLRSMTRSEQIKTLKQWLQIESKPSPRQALDIATIVGESCVMLAELKSDGELSQNAMTPEEFAELTPELRALVLPSLALLLCQIHAE